MAELKPESAAALCAALAAPLSEELGAPVGCVDVSAQNLSWHFEARDMKGNNLRRRISHTRAVSQDMARAGSQMVASFSPALERSLAARGIRGIMIGYHARTLPSGRKSRERLAEQAAEQIAEHVALGKGAGELWSEGERLQTLGMRERGPSPELLPLYEAISHIRILEMRDERPAKVGVASSDRLTCWLPPLYHVVLPVVTKKQEKHGGLAADLTLVIQLEFESVDADSVEELREKLTSKHRCFRSLYLAKRENQNDVRIERVY